jgi:hypothetical protein
MLLVSFADFANPRSFKGQQQYGSSKGQDTTAEGEEKLALDSIGSHWPLERRSLVVVLFRFRAFPT